MLKVKLRSGLTEPVLECQGPCQLTAPTAGRCDVVSNHRHKGRALHQSRRAIYGSVQARSA